MWTNYYWKPHDEVDKDKHFWNSFFLFRGNLNEVNENDVVYKSRPFKNGIKQKKSILPAAIN